MPSDKKKWLANLQHVFSSHMEVGWQSNAGKTGNKKQCQWGQRVDVQWTYNVEVLWGGTMNCDFLLCLHPLTNATSRLVQHFHPHLHSQKTTNFEPIQPTGIRVSKIIHLIWMKLAIKWRNGKGFKNNLKYFLRPFDLSIWNLYELFMMHSCTIIYLKFFSQIDCQAAKWRRSEIWTSCALNQSHSRSNPSYASDRSWVVE